MHISEGVLSPEIWVPAAAIAAASVAYLIKKIGLKAIPKTAALGALFFVASLIHIPLGPSSIHLLLGGFIGAILGANAVLAIFMGLVFQALFFGYGGIAVLGVNLIIIAFPAVLGKVFLNLSFKFPKFKLIFWFLTGFIPVLISAILLSGVLIINGEEFRAVAGLAMILNLPLMAVEGVISLFLISFIAKINLEILK